MISSPTTFSNPNSAGFRYQNRSKTRHTVACIATTAPPPHHKPSTLYDVLGLKHGATCNEIKAAYRRLVRECHPDAVTDENRKSQSASEFIQVHDAYVILSDPDKRADYDRNVMAATAAAVAGRGRWNPNRSSAYGRAPRNWETDQCW